MLDDTIGPAMRKLAREEGHRPLKPRSFANHEQVRAANARAEQMHALLEQGMTPADVARQTGTSIRTVYNLRNRNGETAETPAARKVRERRERIVSLSRQGVPQKRIAEMVGIRQESVCRILKDADA